MCDYKNDYTDYDDADGVSRKERYMKKHTVNVAKEKIHKAKHKHEYVPCSFDILDLRQICNGRYCKVCGKIDYKIENNNNRNNNKFYEKIFTVLSKDKYIDRRQM